MQAQLASDLNEIFESLDSVTATFTIGPSEVCVRGWFSEGTDAVRVFGAEVEAVEPSFTAPTAKLADVRNKMAVTIADADYLVERLQKMGNGVSVVYLKTKQN